MKSTQVTGGYLLVFKPGEKLVENIKQFCQERIVRGGWLSGLGAARQAEIGYYNLESREYHFTQIDKLMELVGLTGNVAVYQNEVFVHIHAVLSDENLKTFGGHLKEAEVGGTMEVMLKVLDTSLVRQVDKTTGLKTIS